MGESNTMKQHFIPPDVQRVARTPSGPNQTPAK